MKAAITKSRACPQGARDLAEDPHVQFWCSEASCHSSGWKSRQYWLMESTAILSGPDCPLADRAARRLELSWRGPDSRFKKRGGFLTLTGEPENQDDKSGPKFSSAPWRPPIPGRSRAACRLSGVESQACAIDLKKGRGFRSPCWRAPDSEGQKLENRWENLGPQDVKNTPVPRGKSLDDPAKRGDQDKLPQRRRHGSGAHCS